MPPTNPCSCPTCKGNLVPAKVQQLHERALRRAQLMTGGPPKLRKIIPRNQRLTGPVPRHLESSVSPERRIPTFPDLDFPPRTSPDPVKQEIGNARLWHAHR